MTEKQSKLKRELNFNIYTEIQNNYEKVSGLVGRLLERVILLAHSLIHFNFLLTIIKNYNFFKMLFFSND